jgi:hypothetical protein
VIDITGDALLARTVLRALCDIPNNKKAPEPLRTEDVVQIARAGAPGERATVQAVAAVLGALEEALIVVKFEGSDGQRWSLIHDYLVEPIKLATEEQTTRAEAAVARLDYFISKAREAPSTIVALSELRAIRRDAPPAATNRLEARRLIRRSLLMGYGRPVGELLVVALSAIVVVLALATERQWKVVTERNHWEGPSVTRSRVTGRTTVLHGGSDKRVVILSNPSFLRDDGRLTTWDAETGELIGVLSGRLSFAGGWLWRYDNTTGRLSRLDAAGKEVWNILTPEDSRPEGIENVDGFDEPNVMFRDRISDSFRISLDIKSNKWKHFAQHEIYPESGSGIQPSGASFDYATTKILRAVLVNTNAGSRLTI